MRTATKILTVVGGVAVAGAIAYGADTYYMQDRIPRGVIVADVAVGGKTRPEAQALLEEKLHATATEPVAVVAGSRTTTVDPKASGLTVDIPATLDAAGEQPANPITRLSALFAPQDVGVVSRVDDTLFQPAVQGIVDRLYSDPVDGAVWLEGGKVRTAAAEDGQKVEAAEVADKLSTYWLSAAPVEVTAEPIPPVIDNDQVKDIAEGPAAAAVSDPIVVHGRDNVDGVLPIDDMQQWLTFPNEEGTLVTRFDRDAAVEHLRGQLSTTEAAMKNAGITLTASGKQVTPSVDGVTIDWAQISDTLEGRVLTKSGKGDENEKKEFEAIYRDIPATFTTAQAEKATFDQQISTFTTSGFSGPSGTNIARVAQMVDGAIVAPGDVFSLNGYTGPRGSAQGFVESGIILNGRADKAVGGGISQFATTLFNAAYFAGMEDVAHTPHSYYISRYPAGREATVFEGAIDLQFKNTSEYPVLIRTNFGGGSITVSMYGVKTVEVESINGGRWNQTQPQPVTVTSPNCVPSGGAPGFTTSDTKVVRNLQGAELSRSTRTTVYDPQPIVRCG